MTQIKVNHQYNAWVQHFNKTHNVVSCMLVDTSRGQVVAHAGLKLDRDLIGLIHRFYVGASVQNKGEQLIASEKHYHLTRTLDKEGLLFIHVVVKKRTSYLPLIRLKISNLMMSFSFSSMMASKESTTHTSHYHQRALVAA